LVTPYVVKRKSRRENPKRPEQDVKATSKKQLLDVRGYSSAGLQAKMHEAHAFKHGLRKSLTPAH